MIARSRRSLAVALAGLVASVAAGVALEPAVSASDRVKVVVLVVDGLHPDEVDAIGAPNLNALKQEGTWYEESRSIFVAETIPNHVAMMTGAYGRRSGIPANKFWSRDGADEPGVDMEDPALLRASTLFTAIDKRCSSLRTAAILSKTYLHGIFSGDRNSDGQPDADFLWEPGPIVPGSGHTPDISTTETVLGEIPNSPDLMFINLGDVDRSGHVDPSGVQDPIARRAVLQNTDLQVGRIVDALKAAGEWDNTVMFIVSDHSMDWSAPQDFISLDAVFAADERTAGTYEVVQNGGVDNIYLKPDTKQRWKVRGALYELASATEGVAGVYYRQPNRLDPSGARIPKAWGLRTKRVGDIIALAEPGRRFSDPSSSSNPIPGNHGHAITRHNVTLITGGAAIVEAQSIPASDPGAIDPLDDTTILTEQSENVDIGVTAAWLLGIPDPGGKAHPQFQGRVLKEAFSSRPSPSCE